MEPDGRVRPVGAEDWDGIVALEAAAYAAMGISEDRSALESKVWASPTTCCVLDLGHRLAGYLLALPYPALEFPDLTRPEEVVFRSRNLHLHDLVVAGDLRGRGLGKRLLRHLTAGARQQGYEQISLVAVDGSHTFWSANGFTPRPGAVNSASYGPSSVYMSMALRSEEAGTPTTVGGQPGGSPARDEVG
ncbi:Ribosomal protein S18 acetylase RimI [Streptomyces sp. DvalAA-14]|uniref:GNAT family N-acetyltransferase n=1 Tax=unclassified Streptomyces TaxID=2593676 RepID=UPI00081AF94E|nr:MULTISPECIES: GNAT family N-acetyltransferase [unclassified Streptomyces]MYS23464.1 GNAT family N-acetyltransferase [Streptomyces sp. SID4948]SCE33692.1 Ribosomal protein S18 acetylase RimI [Streptomyces sp. DvalAA-14]